MTPLDQMRAMAARENKAMRSRLNHAGRPRTLDPRTPPIAGAGAVYALIAASPGISSAAIADRTGLTPAGVDRATAALFAARQVSIFTPQDGPDQYWPFKGRAE